MDHKKIDLLESNIFFMNYIGYNFAKHREIQKVLNNRLSKFYISEKKKVLGEKIVDRLNDYINQYIEYKLKTSKNLVTCNVKECSDYYIKKAELLEKLIQLAKTRVEFLKSQITPLVTEAFPVIPILGAIAAGSGIRGYYKGKKSGRDVAEKILAADDYLTTIKSTYEYVEKMRERITNLQHLKKANCGKFDKKCKKSYDNEILYIQNEINIESENYKKMIRDYDEVSNLISKKNKLDRSGEI